MDPSFKLALLPAYSRIRHDKYTVDVGAGTAGCSEGLSSTRPRRLDEINLLIFIYLYYSTRLQVQGLVRHNVVNYVRVVFHINIYI